MIETSARLLRLLGLLQTHREWTGSELADRLGVSGRTVRKDIERLRDLGYPVDATRGSAGGYRLGVGATVPPLLLDDDEAVATVIGLGAASSFGLAGIEDASLRALVKLERTLPDRLRRRVQSMREFASRVPPDTVGPLADPATLQSLAGACRTRERQRIAYERHDGTSSRRNVDPHHVVSWGRRWYLVAWDTDRDDWRTFRVDRISRVEPTGLLFTPRGLPEDVTTYISRNVSRAAWRYHARVTVFAPVDAVRQRINPAVGSVEPLDEGTCVLETGADDLWTLAVYLGALDHDFRVDDPPELVEHLRRLADRYARAAGNAGNTSPR